MVWSRLKRVFRQVIKNPKVNISHVQPRQIGQSSKAPPKPSGVKQVPVIAEDHPAAQELQQLRNILAQDPEWQAQHSNTGEDTAALTMAAMEQTTPFKYQPLKEGEIRLVALHPGRPGAELMCSLMTTQLGTGPQMPYEALSYAWGDAAMLHQVRCNNSETIHSEDGRVFQSFPFKSDQSIKVSPNLKDALYRLRVDDDFRMLWIDAICIDQSNIQERSSQVQRMTDIYHYADNVIIWLGEEDNLTEAAFNCIDNLNGMQGWLRQTYPNPDTVGQLQEIGLQPWKLPRNSPGFLEIEKWSAFRTLMRKSTWFMRAWTFQEVVAADEAVVICGGLSRSWDEMVSACEIASAYRITNTDRALSYWNEGEDAYTMIVQVTQRGETRSSRKRAYATRSSLDANQYFSRVQFETLLFGTRLADATDARDKVYSVLSIARSSAPMPKVDYSLDVREVYLQVAKHWLKINSDIGSNIGAFFGGVQMANPMHRLPSWVVDWSTPPVTPLLATLNSFKASGNTEPSIRFVGHEASLPQRGVFKPAELAFLDAHVRNATEFFPGKDTENKQGDPLSSLCAKGVVLLTVKDANRRRTLSDAAKHLELMNAFADPYPTTSKPYVEIYPKVVNPQKPEDYKRQSEAGVLDFWAYKKKNHQSSKSESSVSGFAGQIRTKDDINLPETFEAIGAMEGPFGVFSRSFFVTEDGFMGIGPNRTQKGDRVCILYGCPCPFIIRPLSKSGRYWFVGECYVFGIMDGEAMVGMPQDRVQELIFN